MRLHLAWIFPSFVPLSHSPAKFSWKYFIINHLHMDLQDRLLEDPTTYSVTLYDSRVCSEEQVRKGGQDRVLERPEQCFGVEMSRLGFRTRLPGQ